MTVIAPAEGHARVIDADQPTVGDGDPVGVAAEIGEDMFGRTERRLGIDDPVLAAKLTDRSGEGIGVTEPVERAGEAQSPGRICRLKSLEEQPPEQAGEDMDGQEEARPATEPAPIGAERAAGDEAMDVRMMGERLTPRCPIRIGAQKLTANAPKCNIPRYRLLITFD